MLRWVYCMAPGFDLGVRVPCFLQVSGSGLRLGWGSAVNLSLSPTPLDAPIAGLLPAGRKAPSGLESSFEDGNRPNPRGCLPPRPRTGPPRNESAGGHPRCSRHRSIPPRNGAAGLRQKTMTERRPARQELLGVVPADPSYLAVEVLSRLALHSVFSRVRLPFGDRAVVGRAGRRLLRGCSSLLGCQVARMRRYGSTRPQCPLQVPDRPAHTVPCGWDPSKHHSLSLRPPFDPSVILSRNELL
jgi:hypothetical protein